MSVPSSSLESVTLISKWDDAFTEEVFKSKMLLDVEEAAKASRSSLEEVTAGGYRRECGERYGYAW